MVNTADHKSDRENNIFRSRNSWNCYCGTCVNTKQTNQSWERRLRKKAQKEADQILIAWSSKVTKKLCVHLKCACVCAGGLFGSVCLKCGRVWYVCMTNGSMRMGKLEARARVSRQQLNTECKICVVIGYIRLILC